jgi:PIN domain nuclease of toxin-antitoxin system
MKVLIDTHTFLWFINGDRQLSRTAREILEDLNNERIISVISLWEIAIKVKRDKMRLAEPFDVLIPAELNRNLIEVLDFNITHVSHVAALPLHSREPFDRALVAQAIVERLPVVSVDAVFDAYGVQRLW